MVNQKSISLFRKVATSIWHDHGDPSVYGFVELDVTSSQNRPEKLLPLIIKALSQTMSKNPELRSMIRWGKVVRRDDHCISVMVNIPGPTGDLSVLNLNDSNQLSLQNIQKQIEDKAGQVRQQRDPHLGPLLKIIPFIPRVLLKYLLRLYAASIYDLNAKLPSKFLPRRPFGSVIVSNVGSLGIKKALLPLVPLARPALMIAIGKTGDEPRAIGGQVVIRKISHLGITFDHRIFDGSHAAKMLNDFETAFYSLIES